MQEIFSQSLPGYGADSRMADVRPDRKPMHPDDYRAHLAWVTAKRCHENSRNLPVW